MKDKARGFKLLQEYQRATSSIFLFNVNGTKFLVSIHFTFLRLQLRKKNYEFEDEFSAFRFFEKVAYKLGHEPSTIGQ